MPLTETTIADGHATLTLDHGKVNAMRLDVVAALDAALAEIEEDDGVTMLLLTARGPFFSFGFDVPHFLGQSREEFRAFLLAFTSFYTRLFLFPKPTIAAINGHAVAGGWMLAQACDARVLVTGKTKVGLNEVRFGATLFAGSCAILRHLAGGRVADEVAGGGDLFDPDAALARGLVDELCDLDALPSRAAAVADERFGGICQPSFGVIRNLVRGPVVDAYRDREAPSIDRFLDVWFTPTVQEALALIKIRG